MSFWPLLVGVWRVSGGCLKGAWKVSGRSVFLCTPPVHLCVRTLTLTCEGGSETCCELTASRGGP